MSRIADRIVRNGREHWVLYALSKFEEAKGHAPDAHELYVETGEKFPDEGYVRAGLHELANRALVESTDGGYTVKNAGAVCLKQNGTPKKPAPWLAPDPPSLEDEAEARVEEGEEVELSDIFPDRPWQPTEHARIWFGSQADKFKGEKVGVGTAKEVKRRLPDDFEIVITVGPWRFHDMAYAIDPETHVVRIDLYSVRPDESKWGEPLARAVQREWLEFHKWEGDENSGNGGAVA